MGHLLVAALAATSPVVASRPNWKTQAKHGKAPPAPAAELQLKRARAPQGAQRAEFSLKGEASAFEFNFAADVYISLGIVPAAACGVWWLSVVKIVRYVSCSTAPKLPRSLITACRVPSPTTRRRSSSA